MASMKNDILNFKHCAVCSSYLHRGSEKALMPLSFMEMNTLKSTEVSKSCSRKERMGDEFQTSF